MKDVLISALLSMISAAAAIPAFAQPPKTLDRQFSAVVARESAGWKSKDSTGSFTPNMTSSGPPLIFTQWTDGERNLSIMITLNKRPEDSEGDFRQFFMRAIMPKSSDVQGVGKKAVMAETARSVEVAFARENLFVRVGYMFPLTGDKKTPSYYLPAPAKEIERIVRLAKMLDAEITGPRSLTSCRNDFFDISKTVPATDEERLLDAASKGDTSTVTALLAAGIKPTALDESGNSALHKAVMNGCAATVKALTDAKVALEPKNKRGETPLMIAANFHQIESIRVLLAASADPKARNKYNQNVLMYATEIRLRMAMIDPVWTRDKRMETLKTLIDAGADLNEVTGPYGETVLTNALRETYENTELIIDLIEAGANVNAPAAHGQTPIMRAVMSRGPDNRNGIVKLLIDRGANVAAKDIYGKTATDYAREEKARVEKIPEAAKGNAETIRLLDEAAVKR